MLILELAEYIDENIACRIYRWIHSFAEYIDEQYIDE